MEQEIIETGHHIGGATFGTFFVDMLVIFIFVAWFWILIRVLMDLFRRSDVSGVMKVIWVIFLVVLPYIGIFAYLLTQGWGMSERDAAAGRSRPRAPSARGWLQRRRRGHQARPVQGFRLDLRRRVQEAPCEADLKGRDRRGRPPSLGGRPTLYTRATFRGR